MDQAAGHEQVIALVGRHLQARKGDPQGILACRAEGMAREIGRDECQKGQAALRAFLVHADREPLEHRVLMTGEHGTRAAAERCGHGSKPATDQTLREPEGQPHLLPASKLLAREDGPIARDVAPSVIAERLRQVRA